jgi:type VI secretion system secreted protein Hcp
MILMRLPAIPGDSLIEGYTNWISCTSISWSLTREFTDSAKAGTGDLYTGVSEIGPIEINKSFDCSSPLMMKLSAGGGVVGDGSDDKAQIHILMSGSGGAKVSEKPRDNCYLQFTLLKPIIASWSISGDEDARPTETVSIWYYKVHLIYRQFDGTAWNENPKGGAGWDRQGHKAWADGSLKWQS